MPILTFKPPTRPPAPSAFLTTKHLFPFLANMTQYLFIAAGHLPASGDFTVPRRGFDQRNGLPAGSADQGRLLLHGPGLRGGQGRDKQNLRHIVHNFSSLPLVLLIFSTRQTADLPPYTEFYGIQQNDSAAYVSRYHIYIVVWCWCLPGASFDVYPHRCITTFP